ncbi:cytochrome P450 [Mycena latifolia]|nr:cytochrome P450 [Mycena latifolia]
MEWAGGNRGAVHGDHDHGDPLRREPRRVMTNLPQTAVHRSRTATSGGTPPHHNGTGCGLTLPLVRVATTDDLIPISHPVVLRNGKIIHENEHIRIRKGSFVHIPLEGINLSEDIWGSDAREFNPDRWTCLPAGAKPPSFPGVANVMSFSFGGHSCPGYRFSLSEIKIIIATLLPQFAFTPVEGIEIGKYNSVLTRPFVRDQLASGGIQLPLRITRYID